MTTHMQNGLPCAVARFSPVRLAVILLIACAVSWAQSTAHDSAVPHFVNYTGVAKDINGKSLRGIVGATFAVYSQQEGGAPLWVETQNIEASPNGSFSVMLGATKPDGLPADLFSSGQARWLGVSYNGQGEQPRVALLSVPYALKAGDAQTLGGLPASAFVLAAPPASYGGASTTTSVASSSGAPAPPSSAVTGTGTVNFLPLWDSTSDLVSSVLFQSGSGTTARVGINTTSPTSTLDVKGGSVIRGTLALPTQGNATAAKGFKSQPITLAGSAFNSSTAKPVNQIFAWQTQPVSNDTTSPSGALSLLFASGTAVLDNTGLTIASNGQITFATGQTFPGAGTITGVTTASSSGLIGGGTNGSLSLSLLTTCAKNQVLRWNGTAWACGGTTAGTITGVTAGTDLTGGGTSGTVTLNLDTTKVPLLSAANTFVGSQNITGSLTTTGSVNGNQGFFSNSTGAVPVEAVENDTTRVDDGIGGYVYSAQAGSAGVVGGALAKSGEVFGLKGQAQSPAASGVYGLNGKQSTVGGATGSSAGVWGDAGAFGLYGVLGTADGLEAVAGVNNSTGGYPAIVGENIGVSGIAPGVAGFSSSGVGMGMLGANTGGYSSNFINNAGFNPVGVTGDSAASAGIGVWGSTDTGTSVYGSTGSGIGVYGLSTSGTGVQGYSPNVTGVYGQSDATGGTALYGYAPNGTAVVAASNSGPAISASNNSDVYSTATFINNSVAEWFAFYAGSEIAACTVTTSGHLACDGGTSSSVPLSDSRRVELYSMQSPENWFEDFGSGSLSGGRAVIPLEPTFRDTVNSSVDYKVFLTPTGDCKGLFVAEKTPSGFVVRELGGGQSDIAFDYRIVARRKGYEGIRLADVTAMHNKQMAQLQKMANRPSPKPLVMPNASERTSKPQIQMPILHRHAQSLPFDQPRVTVQASTKH